MSLFVDGGTKKQRASLRLPRRPFCNSRFVLARVVLLRSAERKHRLKNERWVRPSFDRMLRA